MPSTDIDGTPLLILGAPVVRDLYKMFRGQGGPWAGRKTQAVFSSKLRKFMENPQVVKWFEENPDA